MPTPNRARNPRLLKLVLMMVCLTAPLQAGCFENFDGPAFLHGLGQVGQKALQIASVFSVFA